LLALFSYVLPLKYGHTPLLASKAEKTEKICTSES
jgi:hypothetical protein